MAWIKKGGVLTKKVMMTVLAISIAALFVCSMFAIDVNAADDNPANTNHYTNIQCDNPVIEISKSTTYRIFAGQSATYTAKVVDSKGQNVSGASASPSTGSVDVAGVSLTITAPSSDGKYYLEVKFTFTDGTDSKKTEITQRALVHAVKPIVLKVTLENKGEDSITNLNVYFIVDGVKYEVPEPVSVSAKGKTTVTYNLIVADLSNGAHSYALSADIDPGKIGGLDEVHHFYVGQSDHTWILVLMVIGLIAIVAILIWLYRKPVKNLGKPKARR